MSFRRAIPCWRGSGNRLYRPLYAQHGRLWSGLNWTTFKPAPLTIVVGRRATWIVVCTGWITPSVNQITGDWVKRLSGVSGVHAGDSNPIMASFKPRDTALRWATAAAARQRLAAAIVESSDDAGRKQSLYLCSYKPGTGLSCCLCTVYGVLHDTPTAFGSLSVPLSIVGPTRLPKRNWEKAASPPVVADSLISAAHIIV